MKNRGIFILIIGLFSCLSLSGQEISHEVLVPAASVVTNGNYSISQSIGEPIVKLLQADYHDLTQGFQQPLRLDGEDYNSDETGSGANVYPNPVIYDLTVKMWGDKNREFEVVIFAINGTVFFRRNYKCVGDFRRLEYVDMRDFKRGMYFVRVRSVDDQIVKLFKIEKL